MHDLNNQNTITEMAQLLDLDILRILVVDSVAGIESSEVPLTFIESVISI